MIITEGVLPIAATTEIPGTPAKKTWVCFIGKRWRYRDSDIGRWLAAESQPETATCVVTTFVPSKEATVREWAAWLLGVPVSTPLEEISTLLKERNYTMTLGQVEEMVEATERGLKTDLRTDGFGNFYFVENADGSVSAGCVCRGGRDWYAYIHRLSDPYSRSSGRRLLVPNFTANP